MWPGDALLVEIAGPEQFRLDELIRGAPKARDDPRDVTTDPDARYFGINQQPATASPLPPITTIFMTRHSVVVSRSGQS